MTRRRRVPERGAGETLADWFHRIDAADLRALAARIGRAGYPTRQVVASEHVAQCTHCRRKRHAVGLCGPCRRLLGANE